MPLYNRLKEYRARLGVNQQEMGALAGVSRQTISQIGRAAYHAYQVTSYACLVLWVLLLIGDVVFAFGLLPVFVVMLLWGVLQVSYILDCIRQSGRKK